MYAFFLLALLADMARSQVPASFGGESAGGSILRAAGQIRVSQAGEVVLVSRRLDRGQQTAVSFNGSSLTLSRLARLFSSQSNHSTLMLLLAAPFTVDSSILFAQTTGSLSIPASRGIFEHTGSPAP